MMKMIDHFPRDGDASDHAGRRRRRPPPSAAGVKAMLALLETPSGFALFCVVDSLFNAPACIWSNFAEKAASDNALFLEDFIKVDDKSAARRMCGNPGEKLADLIRKHKNGRTMFVVDDEELKLVIEEKLGAPCFYEKYAVGELMWGLKNVLRYYLSEERDNITREYLLPLCQGIKDLINNFGIDIPTEEIDEEFIVYAGRLFRSNLLLKNRAEDIRERCDKLVPDIGAYIEDDLLYAETMAKILIPKLGPTWDFAEKFPSDMVPKLKAAAKAAKVKYGKELKSNVIFYQQMGCTLTDLRLLPGARATALGKAKKRAADRCSGGHKCQIVEKRSHQAVEAAEGAVNRYEDFIDASAGGGKKAKTL
ncbi:hypothetical protein ACP70R_030868 [Stipagrostis hirtigluma subsp. patula]